LLLSVAVVCTLSQEPRTVISTEAAHSLIVRSAVEKSAFLPRPSPSHNAFAVAKSKPCHPERGGPQHFVSREVEGPAVALAVACSSIIQPTVSACPMHRALCDGWDNKHSINLSAFAVLIPQGSALVLLPENPSKIACQALQTSKFKDKNRKPKQTRALTHQK
jgi:hypothetical protein